MARTVLRFCAASLVLSIATGASADARRHRPEPAAPRFGLFGFWPFQQPLGALVQPPARETARSPFTDAGCLPPAIRMALADVQARFGPVEIVSTHRPGSRIRGTRHASHHATCQAADFKPPPGRYAAVASYLRQTWNGGMGTYSSGHIHIDTGPNYRWHQGSARAKRRR